MTNLNDILDWISRNGVAAFLIGCFLITLASVIAKFLIALVRALTGKYPSVPDFPPPPVPLCNASDPCYCCRESMCNEDCRCYSEDD